MKKVFVDCVREGKIIATYDFGYGETIGPSARPSHETVVNSARSNLTSERIAFPPYAGIEFKVRWG
jgi:hypothetical protein